jgi:hypothetical protein
VPSDHEIVLMGDEHSGNLLSYEDGIKEVHDYILSAGNRFVVKMGDRIDAIASDDKRYDLTAKEPIPLQQAKQAIKDDLCVADRTLVRLQGNHEMKLWRFGDLAAFIAEELKQPYGTYSCVLEVSDQFGPMYRIWLSHGFRTVNSNAKDWEQRIANMKANLKMKMKYKAGDCLVMAMGHSHKLLTVMPAQKLYLTYGQGKPKQHYLSCEHQLADFIDEDSRWYINTGSFLKQYGEDVSGYGEVNGYDPVEMGSPIIVVHDRKVTGAKRMVV